ncbi:MAG TPA: acyl-CoA dehydrogenase family protein [Bacillota bacterium]|nr:acyl-CoA dehydrogenase family protein [Bacillota bacterium]
MKIELTEQQQKKKAEFRDFVDQEIIPFAAENDREERISPEMIQKLARKGFLGSMLPKEYSQESMDMVTLGILNEEIGRGCSSVRSLLTVHGMLALALSRWGTPEQKSYWLPKMVTGEVIGAFGLTEPNIGSDAKSVETTAVLTGDTYVLNGKKKWITMGQIADVFLIFAQCEGKPTAFLVEKTSPGFSSQPIHGLLGARASMVAELHLDDCRIPRDNLVGRLGFGLSHVALSALDYGRYTIAWGCVGLGQACLEESIHYARKRKQFGAPLRENQLIQKMITEMVVNVKAARLLCFQAGYLKDVGDPDSIMETWNAKYFASTMVMKVASDAVQIHGANGCCQDYPVERYYRDAKINEIIEGTSQMHEVLIATNAFRNL